MPLTASVMRRLHIVIPLRPCAPAWRTRMATVDDPNENIIIWRSCVIGALVTACADAFAASEDSASSQADSTDRSSTISHSSKKAPMKHATICRGSASTAPPMWLTSSSPGNRIITFRHGAAGRCRESPGLQLLSRLLHLAGIAAVVMVDVDAPDLRSRFSRPWWTASAARRHGVCALDLFRQRHVAENQQPTVIFRNTAPSRDPQRW